MELTTKRQRAQHSDGNVETSREAVEARRNAAIDAKDDAETCVDLTGCVSLGLILDTR